MPFPYLVKAGCIHFFILFSQEFSFFNTVMFDCLLMFQATALMGGGSDPVTQGPMVLPSRDAMVINTGLQSFHSRAEENGDHAWRGLWSRPSGGACHFCLCSLGWNSVIWPQLKGTGNYSLLLCLRGKSNRSSEHIGYLC